MNSKSDSESTLVESSDSFIVVESNNVEVHVRATFTTGIYTNSEPEVTRNQSSCCGNNNNQKRDSLLSMEERPTKMTKRYIKIESEPVEVKVLPTFPSMKFTLQERYTMINCFGVYYRIGCKDITYDEIPMKLYQDDITRTYDKFCKLCNDESEKLLSVHDETCFLCDNLL